MGELRMKTKENEKGWLRWMGVECVGRTEKMEKLWKGEVLFEGVNRLFRSPLPAR